MSFAHRMASVHLGLSFFEVVMSQMGQQRRIDGVRAASGLAHIATELARRNHRNPSSC
jgi:hypothetical protein